MTWTTFAKNLSETQGRPTGYYVAHTGLIVVNLAIAAVLGGLGYRAWKAERVESRR